MDREGGIGAAAGLRSKQLLPDITQYNNTEHDAFCVSAGQMCHLCRTDYVILGSAVVTLRLTVPEIMSRVVLYFWRPR